MTDANEARLYIFLFLMICLSGFVFSMGLASLIGYTIKKMRRDEDVGKICQMDNKKLSTRLHIVKDR
jgi:hypothetical protein